tara:strand:+ start:7233 stop:8270 length:1038 start_codon:yes stop_codon:yes gene_type:complete
MTKRLKNIIKFSIIFVVFAIIGIGGYFYWDYEVHYPNTDDSYVQAHVINVAAQVSGPVNAIFVQDHQAVTKGQLLFTIDPAPFQIAVAQAQAKLILAQQQVKSEEAAVNAAQGDLAQAVAQQVDAQKQNKRIKELVLKGNASKSDGDTAKENLDVAIAAIKAGKGKLRQATATLGTPGENNAEIQQAKADLNNAKLNLTYTKIYATHAGILDNFKVRVGTMITAQQDLFALIEQNQWWVDANFKETQLARIRPGMEASVVVDMYPNHTFHGYVQSVSGGSGAAFSLLPPENATGNWVKVTQRFPVKVMIMDTDTGHPLRVGASAVVTVNTVDPARKINFKGSFNP